MVEFRLGQPRLEIHMATAHNRLRSENRKMQMAVLADAIQFAEQPLDLIVRAA